MAQRLIARFSGTVQGVGFRYTTLNAARGFPGVAGYVRNLPDGRVELVAEGEPAAIAALAEEVKQEMGGYIRSVVVRRAPATGEFGSFRIRS